MAIMLPIGSFNVSRYTAGRVRITQSGEESEGALRIYQVFAWLCN